MTIRRVSKNLFLALEEEIEWIHAIRDGAPKDWHVVKHDWWFIWSLD